MVEEKGRFEEEDVKEKMLLEELRSLNPQERMDDDAVMGSGRKQSREMRGRHCDFATMALDFLMGFGPQRNKNALFPPPGLSKLPL